MSDKTDGTLLPELETYEVTLWLVVGICSNGDGLRIEEFWCENDAQRYAKVMVFIEETFVTARLYATTMFILDKELISTYTSTDLG